MDEAYLLNTDGETIRVLNHPSADFEFDSILDVLNTYGSGTAGKLVADYIKNPNEDIKNRILSIYDNKWCKVRVWENGRLITFRITSTDSFNWYETIVNFLLDNPTYKSALITVESDKRTGVRRTFWNEISYKDAVSEHFETVMATKKDNNR